ncbi:MAG TPA: T9SS type A sorting domain-containing protein [Bacteroidota bacterium]|nr:T9SS type A sorting domain-containing protein [Bacteroidota bacterium]
MCLSLQVAGAQSLFWVDAKFDSAMLCSANTDGSSLHALTLSGESLPEGISISPAAGRVYWGELSFAGARILAAPFDLSITAVLDTGGSADRALSFDSAGSKLYWTTSNLVKGGMVVRADTDGTHAEVLQSFAPSTVNPRGVAVDPIGEKVYWADFDSGTIHRANLSSGASVENVLSGLKAPVGIALDPAAGEIYWTEAGSGTIRRANLDGSGRVTLDSGLAVPNYIALDLPGGAMYWTEIGIPRIRTARLDGSIVRTLAIAANHPEGIAVVPGSTTSVAAAPAAPGRFALAQNYPNPFNPSTTISYAIPRQVHVTLSVFNLLGQRVAILVNADVAAGTHEARFDASGLASGVYIYRLQAGDFVQSLKLVLLR